MLIIFSIIIVTTNQIAGLFPEIIGFCLEGIFFVYLFSLFHKHKEREQKNKSNRVLKETLTQFVSDYVWWSAVGTVGDVNKVSEKKNGKIYMIPLVDQAKIAVKELGEGNTVPPGMLEPIQRYGKRESQMLKCLLPLAAELNPEILKKWFRVIQSLDSLIIDSDKQKDVNFLAKNFLNSVIDFIEFNEPSY